MRRDLLAGSGFRDSRDIVLGGAARLFHSSENLLVSLPLAAMAALPIVEALLRSTLGVGIPGSGTIVQHLTLFVAMLGASVAARERRLLSLSTGIGILPVRVQAAARAFSSGIAAAMTLLLCVAGYQLMELERDGGNMLVGPVPVWVAQAILPLGFGLVGVRLLWHAADTWTGRAVATALAGAIIGIGAHPPLAPEDLVAPALVSLAAATLLGAPIFSALGGTALILFWGAGVPIAAIPVETYRLVVSPTLPTIPLFTLAGYFLAEGGASKRLIRVFQALAGWIRGGPAVVTVLVCAFFTSFTGASGVTILALGGLLMPVLLSARYTERNSLGLLTAAGSLGLMFPPSLPVILYGIVSHTPIHRMFMGSLIPGLLLLALAAWWGIRQGARSGSPTQPFDAREAWRAVWGAKWELLLPAVVLVGLYGGFATLVEAAALTAVYAFVVETFIYKDLRLLRDTPRVISQCGTLVGGVLIILGVALGLTNYMVDAQIPTRALEWIRGAIDSPILFLLLLNIFLLVVGCFMDIFSAIIVVVPLIIPMGQAFGIDPIHLGVIFLANLELGYLTPPVGMNLFLSSYRFGKPLPEVYRSVIPMFMVLLVGVILITYLPILTMWLPGLLGG
jgi:tripartite ATP-independent transporter DctM subunit